MNIGVPKIRLKKSFCFLISGKAGVGKSFTANVLLDLLNHKGYNAGLFPFAYGVKKTGRFMGWDGEKDSKGRRLLQVIGQAGRDYDPDMWVRSTFRRIEESSDYPFDAVIMDDWRFPNEAEFAYKEPLYRPVTVRINAPHRELLIGTKEYDDVSEISLDDYPFMYFISNNDDGKDWIRHSLISMLDEQIKYNS